MVANGRHSVVATFHKDDFSYPSYIIFAFECLVRDSPFLSTYNYTIDVNYSRPAFLGVFVGLTSYLTHKLFSPCSLVKTSTN